MSLLKFLYKRILRKLDLDAGQLRELSNRLDTEQVCAGGFVDGSKMCPNTLALSIKEGVGGFTDRKQAKELFPKYKISLFELSVLFYILFDLPSMLSGELQAKLLNTLKQGVDELSSVA